jgi:hypothetical protein
MNQIETGTAHVAPQAATSALIAATPAAAAANGYVDILNKKIREGSIAAARVLDTIHRDIPKDQIVRAASIVYDVDADKGGLLVHVGQDVYQPSDYALGQLAGRAGVPTTYLRELAAKPADGEGWKNGLAAHILGTHFAADSGVRALVRSVRGQLRGYLSDKFRRLDCRPLCDALGEEAAAIGAVPCDGSTGPGDSYEYHTKGNAMPIDEITEADEAATDARTALDNLRAQLATQETQGVIAMYERAALGAGATVAETEAVFREFTRRP